MSHVAADLSPRRNPAALTAALGITAAFLIVEVIGGALTGSLALLADAGHMASDVGALLLALGALLIARRRSSGRRSYGYLRTEVLAASVNVLALWLIAGSVMREAVARLGAPSAVDAGPMLVIASLGLVGNVASLAILSRSAGESLNIQSAFLHVMGDALGSLGAIVAGVLLLVWGWTWADPVASVFIAALIVVGSLRTAWQTIHILLQGAPSGIRLEDLHRALGALDGVREVHDLHAWVLTSGYNVMSAHVRVDDRLSHDEEEAILGRIRGVATGSFGIAHVTVQLEHQRSACPEAHLPSSVR